MVTALGGIGAGPYCRSSVPVMANMILVRMLRRDDEVASSLRIILTYRRAPLGLDQFRSGVAGDFKIKNNTRFGMLGAFDRLAEKIYHQSPSQISKTQINLIFSNVNLLMDHLKTRVLRKVILDSVLLQYIMGLDLASLSRQSIEYLGFAAQMNMACQKYSGEATEILSDIDYELDNLLALFGLTSQSEI